MARGPYRELTGEQVQHFIERGYVVLEQVLSPELAAEWRSFAFELAEQERRLGVG